MAESQMNFLRTLIGYHVSGGHLPFPHNFLGIYYTMNMQQI